MGYRTINLHPLLIILVTALVSFLLVTSCTTAATPNSEPVPEATERPRVTLEPGGSRNDEEQPTDWPEPTEPTTLVVTATPLVTATATPDPDAAKYGGTLRVAYPPDHSSPDPIYAEAGIVVNMLDQILEPLIRLNPDATYRPVLAESWNISDDAMTYTFNLRQGVTFHNGADFTAEDVVFSLGRARDQDISVLASSLDAVEDVVAVGDYTVRLDLNTPNVFLLDTLFLIQAAMLDSETDIETLRSGEEVSGTGPFMLDELVPRERITMERNPNHWSGDLPYLDEVVFVGIKEQVGRLEALLSGEVDVVPDLYPMQLGPIYDSPDAKVFSVASTGWIGISINNQIPPFDNKLVRQALRYAVDRDLVNQMAFQGLGAPMNDSPVFPGDSRFFAPEYLPEYDPDKARALLAEAGYPDGIDVELETTTYVGPGMLELPAAFKNSAAAAGVRVNIKELPPYWYGAEIPDGFGPLTAFWTVPQPHPNVLLRAFYHSDEVWAVTHFGKILKEGYEFAPYGIADWTTFESVFTDAPGPLAKELDALIERAEREILEQQMVTYREIQAFLAEQVPQLVIVSVPKLAGARNTVQDLVQSPISPAYYYSTVWLER